MAVCAASVMLSFSLFASLSLVVLGLVFNYTRTLVHLLLANSLFAVSYVLATPFTLALFGGVCS